MSFRQHEGQPPVTVESAWTVNRPGKISIRLVVLCISLAAATFIFDLSMPLGVVGGVPYVALVLVGLWVPAWKFIFSLAALGTTLTVLGYFYSPDGGIPWMVLTNRALALFTIWITAILITVLKEGEAAHTRFEQRVREAIEILPEGFFLWDSDDRLVLNNEAHRKMSAVCEPILKPGAKFEEVLRYGAARGLYPQAGDDPARLERMIAEHLQRHRESPNSDERQFGDGRWFKTTRSRTRGGDIVGTRVDVTELKRVNEELKQSESRNASILRSALDGIVTIDEDGRIVEFNPAAETIFGYRRQEVLGKQMAEVIIPPHLRDQHRQGFKRYLETGRHNILSKHIEIIAMRADGEEFQIELTVVPSQTGPHLNFTAFCRDITEHKNAEERLRKLSQAVEQSPASVIITDTDGNIEYVNQKFIAVTGYAPEEIIGQTPRVLKSDHTPPEEYENLWNTITSGCEWRGEMRNRKKNGELYWEFASISPITAADGSITHFIAIKEDIGDRKLAEEKLGESEQRLRELMENVPGFVYQQALHPDGTISFPFVNEGVLDLTGFAPDEVTREASLLIDLVHSEDRDTYDAALRRSARTLEPIDMEFRLVVPTGETKWVRSSSRPRKRDDGTVVWDSILLDVTDIKQTEASLRMAMEQAESANRAKSEFLANMSHELRTPLNAIIGFSEIMKSRTIGPVDNPVHQDYAEYINDSGLHLLDLINDILDLSKLEAGATELDEEDVEVNEVVRAVAMLVDARARKGGVELELDVPSGLPPLRADIRMLKQILINLLSNGIKFTDPGGKVVLKIWYRAESGYIFQIVDSGIGMALEDIPKALKPFAQIDSGIERKFEGSGLGLPLTKSLVELHSGSMDIQSEAGVGTTVTVRFPAERIGVEESAARIHSVR